MSETPQDKISVKTWIPISLVIILLGFFVRQENRITKLESMAANALRIEQQVREMKQDYAKNGEMTLQLKAIETRLEKIEKKLE
jgi:Tfp pilus assembly protein PilO